MSVGGGNFTEVVDVFEGVATHECIYRDGEFKRHLQASLGHEIEHLQNKPYKKIVHLCFLMLFIVVSSVLLAWGMYTLFVSEKVLDSDILPVNVDAPALPVPDEQHSIEFSLD